MFANLSQNSVLYVLETKDEPRITSGIVTGVSLPRTQYATFGQTMDTVIDISATVDGERREFKRIPCNTSIANFGPDAFVLADSKEAMMSHVGAALQTSRNIVESYEKNVALIPKYEAIMEELNPTLKADRDKDRAIQSLKSEMSELKELLLSLTKEGKSKKD